VNDSKPITFFLSLASFHLFNSDYEYPGLLKVQFCDVLFYTAQQTMKTTYSAKTTSESRLMLYA